MMTRIDGQTLSPEFALLAIQNDGMERNVRNASEEVSEGYENLAKARQAIKDAEARAMEAQKESGLWGSISNVLGSDVATLAEVTAGVAVVAGTGGAAAPLVIASIAMTAAAQHAEQLGIDPNVATALAVGGMAAGVASGNGGTVTSGWNTVAGGAQAVQGGATMLGAGAGYVRDVYDERAKQYHADAKQAEIMQHQAEEQQDDGMKKLDTAIRNGNHNNEAVMTIQAERHQARERLIETIG